MIGLMLMTVNERERQILAMAFNQVNIQTTVSAPSYANYVKALQYQPDVIVIEIPRLNHDQLHFCAGVRRNKKSRKIPIIGYGDKIPESEKRTYLREGINQYLERPLKFSILLGIVQNYLKAVNKTIDAAGGDKKAEKDADIALILEANTLPLKKIELVVKHISGLTAFPFTVAKVLRLTESDKSGAGELSKVIDADPVITASILKVANTVFFASINRRITTIKDAIIRVGFRETKRIVMTMSVMDIVGKKDTSFGFSRMRYWEHSLATALIAENFAKHIDEVNSDEAFLAGLLHDFGILLMDEFFPTIFAKVLEATSNSGTCYIDNERALLKITNTDVLKELFTAWKLPECVIEAISWNYPASGSEPKKLASANEKIGLCVFMGNIMAKAYCLGAECDEFVRPITSWCFEEAKMPNGLGKDFYENLMRDLEMYRRFLNIPAETKEATSDKKEIGFFSPAQSQFNSVKEYFKAQGHSATHIPNMNSYTEFDQKFDAIFIWADSTTTPDQIQPMLHLIRRQEQPVESTKTPPLVPVCAIVPQNSPLTTGALNRLSILYNEFDLRQLDDILIRIIAGETVTMQKIQTPAEKPEKAPPVPAAESSIQ